MIIMIVTVTALCCAAGTGKCRIITCFYPEPVTFIIKCFLHHFSLFKKVPLNVYLFRYIYILSNNFKPLNSDMVIQSTANGKQMPELSMLTILIEAAAAVKNKDGDTSLHGYAESQSRVMSKGSDEVDLAVLDSIGDTLLQNHQALAISFDKRVREQGVITAVMMFDKNTDFLAEPPISGASEVISISASVVLNPNDRGNHKREGGQLGGPRGNIKQMTNGKSMWAQVKMDPFFYAVK
jgi:hypothetical protein